jgi:hypothetical protein
LLATTYLIISILEVKILIESIQSSLCNIRPVEVIEHVKNPQLGKHPQVQLPHNLLLQFGGIGQTEEFDVVQVGGYFCLVMLVRGDVVERSAGLLVVLHGFTGWLV